MSGETDLDVLLASMTAVLGPESYVFLTLKNQPVPEALTPQMIFQEAEGTTIIAPRVEAETAGLDFTYPCRKITLQIHSSLEAVGFLARITTALAAAGISVNPVSAFYHDHLFVPEDRAADAMQVLATLSRPSQTGT